MRLKKAGEAAYQFDAMVRFEEGSTEAFDAHRDMDILTGSSYEFGFPNAGSNLLLNSQEALSEETRIVPIRMNLRGHTGPFSFEVLSQALPSGSSAYIRDLYLGEITEIFQGSNFTFTVSDSASGAGDRFELIISPGLVTGGASLKDEHYLFLSPNPSDQQKGTQISMKGFKGNEAQILVTDVTGRIVSSEKASLNNGSMVYPLNCAGFPAGIYTIQIRTQDSKLSRKLIIK
jgi:hypothetical protein